MSVPPAAPPPTPGAPPGDPWFRRRPRLALVVIALFFAAVLLVRLFTDSNEHYSIFYVLPVALAATAFGQRGGLLSSLVAVVLVGVGAVARELSLTPAGWATRVVPLVLLGVLLGRATDRARRAEAERRHFELAALLHREAIEINDSLVQRMTAAKWALESGQTEAGLQALTLAVSEGQRLVSDLIRRAEMGGRTSHVPGVTDGRIPATQEEDAGPAASEAV